MILDICFVNDFGGCFFELLCLEVGKAAEEMWKSMSEEEKAPYEVKSGQRKVEYEKQMKAYNKKQENSANGIGDDHEVDALQAIRRKLKDPRKNLRNWRKGDPCVSNWTGVICTMPQPDGFLHIQELRMLNLNLTGKLAPELGQLSNLTVLNFMWNHNITGSIPKEIGNIKSLKFLLLSGNQLSGPLADELSFLPNLLMFQVDLNKITGSLPKSFVNLISCRHFHMNNNSISGQIPSELSSMPALIHFLLDNNNLMGNLPPEFSQMPKLRILQLDNSNFGGTEIPASYGNMSNLVKLKNGA
ncbi:hypothetical protein V6Z11_A11G194300 [Gossypium hirsutum]